MNIYNLAEKQRELGSEITENNNGITSRVFDNCRLEGAARELLGGVLFGDDFMWERINEKIVNGKHPLPINTYPFGELTDEIFPQRLGIYREKEKKAGLNKLIASMIDYCNKANQKGIPSKDVVILTDTVNIDFIEKIEKSMYQEYRKGGLSVYIFYINDYGLTYVPFMMSFKYYSRNEDIAFAINGDVDIEKITKGYDYASVRYTSYWNAAGINYETIVDKDTITKRKIHPYGSVESEEARLMTTLNKNKFVVKIAKLMEKYPESDSVNALDAGSFEANLFGHLYCGSECSHFYKMLAEIFTEAFENAKAIEED